VIRRWRNLTQFGALLLLVAIPIAAASFEYTRVTGWYQSLDLFGLVFVSPLEGLESILLTGSFFVPLLVGLVPSLLIALLLGRVFCSWVCPVNFLQEMMDRLTCARPARNLQPGEKVGPRPRARTDRVTLPKRTIWLVLAAELAIVIVAGVPLFALWSPPGLVGREIMMAVFYRTLAVEGVILIAILLLNLLAARFFCRYFCPLGGLLAFLGGKRRLRVVFTPQRCTGCGRCDPVCPMGIRPSVGESGSIYCWNCGECVDVCADASLGFRVKR